MLYKAKAAQAREALDTASVRLLLEPLLDGLGCRLVELSVSRHKGSVQVRAVIYNGSSISHDDCSKVHRAISPRLDLAFEGNDINLEVSSPGIDRLIKEGAEFSFYIGKTVRCYRTDITEWTAGILESSDEQGIDINTKEGVIRLQFDIIAKARLA